MSLHKQQCGIRCSVNASLKYAHFINISTPQFPAPAFVSALCLLFERLAVAAQATQESAAWAVIQAVGNEAGVVCQISIGGLSDRFIEYLLAKHRLYDLKADSPCLAEIRNEAAAIRGSLRQVERGSICGWRGRAFGKRFRPGLAAGLTAGCICSGQNKNRLNQIIRGGTAQLVMSNEFNCSARETAAIPVPPAILGKDHAVMLLHPVALAVPDKLISARKRVIKSVIIPHGRVVLLLGVM